jgi:hypothetical protein
MLERGPTIFLTLALVGLIAVLCSEHRRAGGLKTAIVPLDDETYVGLSNAAVQRPGPAYLQFNLPWCLDRGTPDLPDVTDGVSEA